MDTDNQYAGVGDTDLNAQDIGSAGVVLEQSQVQDAGIAPRGESIYSLSAAFGMFNIVVGLMLVAAFLLFFGGLSAYLSRLGLVGREEGLKYMYWGTTVLFMLIVLLGIVNVFESNPNLMYGVVASVIIVFALWAIMKAIQEGAAAEEEH